ncbi:cyl-protein thioesterase 1 [Diaporthe amygdali]|uniref:cyl-protein thioesterase 1 n=1 Tax=Phomopsis amygdali TaxID=1214568 RepID=UPI0022FDDB8E|nr:cyl-protein thioesterase 1 [Diaporthe amygdali]KAJ0123036.1 cyl-protein thioesterase 1 [Diaporthe amygdali]
MPQPLIYPAITEHKSTVIIAHGFGDSGNGYVPIVRNWQDSGLFHDTKFILPSAPAISVTSAGGRPIPAWFDIRGERGPHVTFEDLTQQNQDEEGMLQSRDFFLSLIQNEITKHAIPASQIIMGGFSQGSVMALLTGVTADVQLGGVFCLSGYLALADAVRGGDGKTGGASKFPHAREGTGTEVLMIHGERDPVMNLDWAEKSRDIVKELGYPVDSSIIPGLGHSINQEVLAKVTAFIKRVQGKGRDRHDEL